MEKKAENTLTNVGTDLTTHGDDVDMVDFILMSGMGDIVGRCSKVFGNNAVELIGEDGPFALERPPEEPDVDMEMRLNAIIDSSRNVAGGMGADHIYVLSNALVLDGWSWDGVMFRTPMWMNQYAEIPLSTVREWRGMEWIGGSSSAIKSSQILVRVGSQG